MRPYWAGFDDYPGDPKPTPNLWDATYPDEPKSLGREAARVIEEETSPPGTEVDTHVAGTLRNPCVRSGPFYYGEHGRIRTFDLSPCVFYGVEQIWNKPFRWRAATLRNPPHSAVRCNALITALASIAVCQKSMYDSNHWRCHQGYIARGHPATCPIPARGWSTVAQGIPASRQPSSHRSSLFPADQRK